MLLLGALQLQALSIRFPKFGTPIAAEDKVVFTSVDSSRLICISRADGKIIWETRPGQDDLTAWFLHKGALLVTSGSTLLDCDVNSGKLTPVWNSGLERCALKQLVADLILITGDTGRVDHLMCFDATEKRIRWRKDFTVAPLCHSDSTVYVYQAKRKYATSKGYQPADARLAAVDIQTGSNRWTYSLPSNAFSPEAIAVGAYVVFEEERRLKCIEQRSGKVVNACEVLDPDGPIALCSHGTNAWLLSRESIPAVQSLSIPSLEKKTLFYTHWYAAGMKAVGDMLIGQSVGMTEAYDVSTGKKLWSGGQWNWSQAGDKYVLYSEMVRGGGSATLNEIDVRTGTTRKLYEERLP